MTWSSLTMRRRWGGVAGATKTAGPTWCRCRHLRPAWPAASHAPQQLGEDFPLGLAQLRELLGDVGDRAVVLAQLQSARPRAGIGGIAVRTEAVGQLAPGRRCRRCLPPPRTAASARRHVGRRSLRRLGARSARTGSGGRPVPRRRTTIRRRPDLPGSTSSSAPGARAHAAEWDRTVALRCSPRDRWPATTPGACAPPWA